MTYTVPIQLVVTLSKELQRVLLLSKSLTFSAMTSCQCKWVFKNNNLLLKFQGLAIWTWSPSNIENYVSNQWNVSIGVHLFQRDEEFEKESGCTLKFFFSIWPWAIPIAWINPSSSITSNTTDDLYNKNMMVINCATNWSITQGA